jgi:hypothetical protein
MACSQGESLVVKQALLFEPRWHGSQELLKEAWRVLTQQTHVGDHHAIVSIAADHSAKIDPQGDFDVELADYPSAKHEAFEGQCRHTPDEERREKGIQVASSEQLKALIKSHISRDDGQFYSVAMQVAAHEAKLGHGKLAEELRDMIDAGKTRFGQDASGKLVPIGRLPQCEQAKGRACQPADRDSPGQSAG